MTGQESMLQSAIIKALTSYAVDKKIPFDSFTPFNNQQGDNPALIMADFIFSINYASIFMAETKCLTISRNEFLAFDQQQFNDYKRFERINFPIFYVYNNKNYISNKLPTSHPKLLNKSSEDITYDSLTDCNYSKPSLLDSKHPNVAQHGTLLDFFQNPPNVYFNHYNIGAIIRIIGSSVFNRNNIFLSILGSDGKIIAGIINPETADRTIDLIKKLSENSKLGKKRMKLLNEFLSGTQLGDKIIKDFGFSRYTIQNDKNDKNHKPRMN